MLSKRLEIVEKLCSSATCLKLTGGGMHPPLFFRGSAPARTDNNVSYHYTNQIGPQYDEGQIVTAVLK